MPAATSAKGLPYPLGTDRVQDGDDQIRKLAQSVDNMVQAGSVTVPISTGGTSAQVVVTFPVAYAVAPIVVSTVKANTASSNANTSVDNQTVSNVAINAVRTSTGNMTIHWMAVGPVVAVA